VKLSYTILVTYEKSAVYINILLFSPYLKKIIPILDKFDVKILKYLGTVFFGLTKISLHFFIAFEQMCFLP